MISLSELETEYRFRMGVTRVKDCLANLGCPHCGEEMDARKEFIKLCEQVVEATRKSEDIPFPKYNDNEFPFLVEIDVKVGGK
jgi:hypothetical protein